MTHAFAPSVGVAGRDRGWIANRLVAAVLAVLALALSFAPAARAAPSFPPLTGRVVDDAHVLSPQTAADLAGKLADLEAKTGRQLVVVTLPDLQGYDIEDYGYQLGGPGASARRARTTACCSSSRPRNTRCGSR